MINRYDYSTTQKIQVLTKIKHKKNIHVTKIIIIDTLIDSEVRFSLIFKYIK